MKAGAGIDSLYGVDAGTLCAAAAKELNELGVACLLTEALDLTTLTEEAGGLLCSRSSSARARALSQAGTGTQKGARCGGAPALQENRSAKALALASKANRSADFDEWNIRTEAAIKL